MINPSRNTGLKIVPIKKARLRIRTRYSRFTITHTFFICLSSALRCLRCSLAFSRDYLDKDLVERWLDQFKAIHSRSGSKRTPQHLLRIGPFVEEYLAIVRKA